MLNVQTRFIQSNIFSVNTGYKMLFLLKDTQSQQFIYCRYAGIVSKKINFLYNDFCFVKEHKIKCYFFKSVNKKCIYL